MRYRKALSAAIAAAGIMLATAGDLRAQACTFVTGPDVIVGDVTGPQNYTGAGGFEALSLGTTSCNLGDTWLNWFQNTNQHPVIGGTLYRYKDMGGWFAFEQVGQSWLKHGFFALSQQLCCSNCSSTSGTHLGVGCSDPYTASRNGSQGGLGPKWQVNANKGLFTYPPASPGWSGSTARRLQVALADCEATASPSTTRYFGESHYVTPDDAAAGNQNNNASYRRINVSGSGSAWTFSMNGGTQREQSAIRAWQDTDPTVVETEIAVPGEGGLLILANKVTDLGGGQYHYEYALYNMNSHESIRSFSLPIPAGANITNIGFHDVAYLNGDGEGNVNRSGIDWPGIVSGGAITWATDEFSTNVNANAIRWGTTYNFRFDADVAPGTGDLTLGAYRSGSSFDVSGVQMPAAAVNGVAFCNGSDNALASCPCAPGNPESGCDIAQATGGVELSASVFNPNGMGGGSVTLHGEGFSPVGSPAVTVIRSPNMEPAPVVFGDGLRCIGAVGLVRVQSGIAGGGTIDMNLSHGAGAGTFGYQLWFRNQPGGSCKPEAFNLSNGLQLTW
jgi:hypothetical protein